MRDMYKYLLYKEACMGLSMRTYYLYGALLRLFLRIIIVFSRRFIKRDYNADFVKKYRVYFIKYDYNAYV